MLAVMEMEYRGVMQERAEAGYRGLWNDLADSLCDIRDKWKETL